MNLNYYFNGESDNFQVIVNMDNVKESNKSVLVRNIEAIVGIKKVNMEEKIVVVNCENNEKANKVLYKCHEHRNIFE